MRIHLNLNRETANDAVSSAAHLAHAGVERFTVHGSRSHDLAVDVILSGDGVTGGQWGTAPYKSATWDQWGIFLHHLFAVDPTAKAGPYADGADFWHKTAGRFVTLTYDRACPRHCWDYAGDGAWECRKCNGVTYAR